MRGIEIEKQMFHISGPETVENRTQKTAVLMWWEYSVTGQQPGRGVQPAEVTGLLCELISSSVK